MTIGQTSQIAQNLLGIQMRVISAAGRVNRDPSGVTIIGVTKTATAKGIIDAFIAGLEDFGENRVQVLEEKLPGMANIKGRSRWHMIGTLQKNKINKVLSLFDCIHSIDSVDLAQAVNKRAGKPIDVFIEVNVSGEVSKSGCGIKDVKDIAAEVQKLPNLKLLGLMTIAPESHNPEDSRPYFRKLKELNESLGLKWLSMGMTNDFEVAVEEGATHLRIGRAIFGEMPA